MVQSKGPGPKAFLLPTTIGYENHDIRKIRQPQYSFGMKTNNFNIKTSGPGPIKYYINKYTRFGPENIPAFSFGLKTKIKYSSESSPGPAAYNIGILENFKSPSSPAFSFGIKHIDLTKHAERTPGPNMYYEYKLNSYKPSSPAFSITGRAKYKPKDSLPGPSAYDIINLDTILRKSPAYSLGGRYVDVKLKSTTPGPNKYNIISWKIGNNAPAYSFGIRHSPKASPLIHPCDN